MSNYTPWAALSPLTIDFNPVDMAVAPAGVDSFKWPHAGIVRHFSLQIVKKIGKKRKIYERAHFSETMNGSASLTN